jgi:tripartite-type tricarboxylate transporter receptor subunit TctC
MREDNVILSRLAKSLLVIGAALLLGAQHPASAQSSSGLFAGKTVSILIGFSPGGSNDVWARVMSKHFGKHLPGNPTIVVQNFPGAGGLRLMNELYNASPKDGTVLGLVNRGLAFEPLLGGANTRFDATKMNWIGSPDRDITICVARKDAPVQTLQDLFSKTLVVGASGSGADTAIYPQFLSELLGMKFKIVLGYPGSKDISVAMERNEVEGICVAYETVMRQNLARQGQLNILFQAALQADPRIKDVPVGTDLAQSEQDRAVLKLFFARVAMGRPIVAPPGVDPERVAALRKGFDEMMKDEAFLAEAKAIDLRIDAITGQELTEVVESTYRTPKEVVTRAAEILGHLNEAAKNEKK